MDLTHRQKYFTSCVSFIIPNYFFMLGILRLYTLIEWVKEMLADTNIKSRYNIRYRQKNLLFYRRISSTITVLLFK